MALSRIAAERQVRIRDLEKDLFKLRMEKLPFFGKLVRLHLKEVDTITRIGDSFKRLLVSGLFLFVRHVLERCSSEQRLIQRSTRLNYQIDEAQRSLTTLQEDGRHIRQIRCLEEEIAKMKSDRSTASAEFIRVHRRQAEEVGHILARLFVLRSDFIAISTEVAEKKKEISDRYIMCCDRYNACARLLRSVRSEDDSDLLPINAASKPGGVWH